MKENREEIRRQFTEELGSREVIVVPAKEEFKRDINERHELVGAYSRVSTMSGQQLESYEEQKYYYVNFIKQHPNWTMVKMYADEGISATSTKKRKAFLQLIADCEAGAVTLIVTKTVTRFARNVVDCISTCRKLKALSPPVGVLFEGDNINTLSEDSELKLSVLAIVAQSDSETKSSSIRWAFQNRFRGGIPIIADLYGFDRTKKRVLTINEPEAIVVRCIYQLFLDGNPISHIIKLLKDNGIPSPSGNDEWTQSSILYILRNEKYAGNVTMQKTFTESVFSHRSVKNIGQVPQYKIEQYHPSIIPVSIWEKVQKRLDEPIWADFLDTTLCSSYDGIPLYPLSIGASAHDVFIPKPTKKKSEGDIKQKEEKDNDGK